jgi:hypothetical protein
MLYCDDGVLITDRILTRAADGCGHEDVITDEVMRGIEPLADKQIIARLLARDIYLSK